MVAATLARARPHLSVKPVFEEFIAQHGMQEWGAPPARRSWPGYYGQVSPEPDTGTAQPSLVADEVSLSGLVRE
ncbi:MAG: hypothetical protein WA624_04420 [Methylocella sp.]